LSPILVKSPALGRFFFHGLQAFRARGDFREPVTTQDDLAVADTLDSDIRRFK
jgi:hypothetical protein